MSGAASATFVYDGDDKRVKATFGSATTVYVGDYFEWTGSISTMKKYYYAGGARVVMRDGSSTLYWLLSDHLGSTAITVNSGGTAKVGELRYFPYGKTRYTWGTTPTARRFTGQVEDVTIALYFYNARYYDPALGRFVQADTIVPSPGNPQDWNRYSYVANNPVRFTDPSGHFIFNRPNWMYFVPGLNAVAYAKDCAVSIIQAINAYNAGERRVGALAMHATGSTDALVRQAETVSRLNTDVDVVFSNAPLEERLPHAVHLGVWATGKAAEIVAVAQLASAGYAALTQSSSEQAIGWTGEIGENALRELGGQSQVLFRTSQGGRYVDQLVSGIANESKVGYTSLTQSIQQQIAKDAELMATGQVDAVVWHFFRSPATGLAGPSQSLMEALAAEGITVIVY